jgi:hypothetical protein
MYPIYLKATPPHCTETYKSLAMQHAAAIMRPSSYKAPPSATAWATLATPPHIDPQT